MRQFLYGLFLGLALMYLYFEKDSLMDEASSWFASASHDAAAEERIKAMEARKRR